VGLFGSKPDIGTDGLPLGWSTRATFESLRRGEPVGTEPGEPLLYAGDRHLLTIAPTGSGKGRGAIIPTLLSYPGPTIVIDPKGENYRVTGRYRRELGHEVHVIDPFGLTGETTDSLNPFDVFRLPGAEFDADAEMLAELLASGKKGSKDPFWDIAAHGLISGLIAYIATCKGPEERHFGELKRLMWGGSTIYNLAVVLDTAKNMPSYAYEEIAGFVDTTDVTRSGILAVARAHARILGSDAVRRSLGPTSIDMNAFVRGDPMTIYFIIPPTKLESHQALLRLWIGTLLLVLMQREGKAQRQTLFLLDECAQLGNLSALRQAVTLMRGYGLQVWMFFQDLSQMKRLYADDWETMVNNCGVMQTFGLNTHLVASGMAEMMGGVKADDLRFLPAELQVTVTPGQPPMIARRPDYLTDKVFAGRFDPNPLYGDLADKDDWFAPHPEPEPVPEEEPHSLLPGGPSSDDWDDWDGRG